MAKASEAKVNVQPQPVEAPEVAPVTELVEDVVDVSEIMRQRVQEHQFEVRHLSYNPAIPDNPFDFSRSGLPRDYEYFQVQVPNKYNEKLNMAQSSILADYINTGWQFLTTDLVSRDGRNGKAIIPNFTEDNGRIIVSGCYIMYASKDWYNRRRAKNEEKAEDKRRQTREAMQQIEGVRSLNESVDVTKVEDYRTITSPDDLLQKVLREK